MKMFNTWEISLETQGGHGPNVIHIPDTPNMLQQVVAFHNAQQVLREHKNYKEVRYVRDTNEKGFRCKNLMIKKESLEVRVRTI